ncbi:MAG: tRNA (5-methylaminomethyl-2-thiouridine)(34)-methyltransferase MnmD [Paracoccaceae bacterium]
MRSDQHLDLQWRDGDVPVSMQFDDPYFSLEDGLSETRHVFLAGNRLPERFRPGFQIAELGFGSGLNLLAALHLWRESGQTGVLRYTSFEAFPMPSEAMIRAQAGFDALGEVADELAPFWRQGKPDIELPDLRFRLVIGDARQTVAGWSGAADAWFLDGFSPAKNPEMWQDDLLAAVGQHSAQYGTAATYTAAGFVRRGLEAAGFTVALTAGFGRKRHMITACLKMPT